MTILNIEMFKTYLMPKQASKTSTNRWRSYKAFPSMMSERMNNFAEAARTDYHTWIFEQHLCGLRFCIDHGPVMEVQLVVYDPSQHSWKDPKVASGDFTHRIVANTQDELAELAAAMNDMTTHFCEIRDTLDRKVENARTKWYAMSNSPASVSLPQALPTKSITPWPPSPGAQNLWKVD